MVSPFPKDARCVLVRAANASGVARCGGEEYGCRGVGVGVVCVRREREHGRVSLGVCGWRYGECAADGGSDAGQGDCVVYIGGSMKRWKFAHVVSGDGPHPRRRRSIRIGRTGRARGVVPARRVGANSRARAGAASLDGARERGLGGGAEHSRCCHSPPSSSIRGILLPVAVAACASTSSLTSDEQRLRYSFAAKRA
ncbi:hypothetical protein B0H14DRAFT_2748725 [Mycena olivaceomarginata]|nr:hypothetical protein B0H14DRAFT_2748725 [Mycena olivaceomarginata]